MTKHKSFHNVGRGKKSVQHGSAQAIGPLFNTRHPRKFKLVPPDKKTAHAAANNVDGKQTPESH